MDRGLHHLLYFQLVSVGEHRWVVS
uniref:Uncharacterized protein n=1 Tax=Arundo donax TaxID=35708 RepID=A0A0A9G1M8_ARUDO